ncbi:bacteriocin [Paenibacillus turpanensis]|uniref:bacteriocin n=1 Tax=Paenibacillus turpanensis TaxID=2689078 RepID=UPI00140A85E7|nr:bacteriocin [Paenibacillus turpanensis]
MTEKNKPAEQEIKTDKEIELSDLSQELSNEEMENVEGGGRSSPINKRTTSGRGRRYA